MKGRQLLQALLLIAALVALVLAWPAIARTARKPRIADWVPTEDPGTVLTVIMAETAEHPGRSYVLSIGATNFGIDVNCTPPTGYTQMRAKVYEESDGVLGDKDESFSSSLTDSASTPKANESTSGFGGFLPRGHLVTELDFSDDVKTKATVAPPMDIRRGAETDWTPLAIVWDQGVLLEWSQNTQHLMIRRSGLPGHAAPVWNGGGFWVGDKGCQFTEDTQIARLFRTRVPSMREGPQNVQIRIIAFDDGIQTDIKVR
ncbi:MAG: hypothetical protein H6838_02565 [Planctomycetes bacterium]|nr:hypothetical protein [Planctomycetota bacterium]MCB9884343.1 hypothetical protein [Planctomycetota bacterium]